MSATTGSPQPRPARVVKPYVPALGPKLKVLLAVIFAAVALLGATGAYLFAVTALNWYAAPRTYTNSFTLWVFIVHAAGGVLAMLPFLVFGCIHLATARTRPNRVAVRLGVLLFVFGLLVGATGLALIQLEGLPQLTTGTPARVVVYVLHLVVPLAALWIYVLHRKAGPRIKWKWGYAWAGAVGTFCVAMLVLHSQDPRKWYAQGPKEGLRYFFPSDSLTADGNFIPANVLMMDEYCLKCHADVFNDHLHSAHKFSSFNNPPYLFSVRETRKVSLERDGDVRAARWCAGCHDPVPFFSGAFDDPNFDDVNHPTAHAGITCTVCHAITNVNSTVGNGAYTIEHPEHYPGAYSENRVMQWLNNQLVKAKPDFHKQTFLKPFHKTAEFCSTCHKVSLPVALNHYKEFLRGQNHYDTFLLSGVSGHGARSFYYPPKAKENCASCHMPLAASNDFGARDFDGTGVRKRHSHFFPAANTGLPALLKLEPRYASRAEGFDKAIQANAEFLRGPENERRLRIDLFGLKEGGSTAGRLIAPLRPDLPPLKPGQSYVVEVVIRTLNIGHPFSQGTVDSNEIWVDFTAKTGGRVVARSGATQNADDTGPVDEWSHFVNVLMLDRKGNRINRRNPQDIFTPLYDHQIGPGTAQVVHYRIDVPADAKAPVELTARLRYRKFDYEYMRLVHKDRPVPKLPIIDMCEDTVTLPIEGAAGGVPAQESPVKPAWQRWNDYGIGCLLEGGPAGRKGYYRQAEEAFRKLLEVGPKESHSHAHVNLARVFIEEGGDRLNEAARELEAAGKADPPAAWWTLAWFTALVNSETATGLKDLDAAIADLERIVDPANQPRDRGFDFSKDYVVLNRLANRLFKRSLSDVDGPDVQRQYLLRAVDAAERVLAIDSEDVEAHDQLKRCYDRLAAGAPAAGDAAKAEEFAALAGELTNARHPRDGRLSAAARLAAGVTVLGREPLRSDRPKLSFVRELLAKLRPAFHAESDPDLRASIAAVLAALHRESHATYKPDENARSHATQEYRKRHPAGNYAARDRAVYATTQAHRDAIVRTGDLPPLP